MSKDTVTEIISKILTPTVGFGSLDCQWVVRRMWCSTEHYVTDVKSVRETILAFAQPRAFPTNQAVTPPYYNTRP
jgi:hypothetical protein